MITTSHHDLAKEQGSQLVPASFAQQAIWFFDQLEPENAIYSTSIMMRLRGACDAGTLEQSLNAIIQRHEVLRTAFVLKDGQLMQVIAPTLTLSVSVVDLRNIPEAQRETETQRLAAKEAHQPFNLAQGPLMRASLLRFNDEEHVLLVTGHQIICDELSTSVFARELAILYGAFCSGKPSPLEDLPMQYGDYACRQIERLQGVQLQAQLQYWQQQLRESAGNVHLPVDYQRAGPQTVKGAHASLVVPPGLREALHTLGQREGVTLFITLLAAFQILLQRHTGQDDFVIGSSISNRTPTGGEGLIGCFVNMVALRAKLAGNPTFLELLVREREVTRDAEVHADFPLQRILKALQQEASFSRPAAFDVMIEFKHVSQRTFQLPGLVIDTVQRAELQSNVPMTLYIEEQEDELRLELVHQPALFSPERIHCMLNQYQHLLEQITANPEKPIGFYSLVTPESARLLPDPRTALPEPEYELLTALFVSWADREPDHIAICQGKQTWTYGELAESSLTLARFLCAGGLEPGDVMAVMGVQSFGLIASMIAVFLSGGVLLPIDRDLPSRRQELMLKEAGVKHIVYAGNLQQADTWLRELAAPTMLRVDPDKGSIVEPQGAMIVEAIQLPKLDPSAAAYIFFTSGTTGTPKGVLGCHKGLSHFLSWQRETFAVGPQDRCAQLTSLSFDAVLRNIFLPLTSGATLCLPEKFNKLDQDQILCWLDSEKISLLHTVPSLAQSWLADFPAEVSLERLRWVFFAGESLTDVLVRRCREIFPEACGMVNLYGPTETTFVKCFSILGFDLTKGVQPVGRALPETQALVLTENNRLCGISEPGEIVLRTPFRTLGYVNAPEENRKRFIKNPFRDDERDVLYRTGDLGRYRLDGSLEVIGRIDHQVKIRGVRVEPDEVMAILQQHPAVTACVAVAQKDRQGQYALVAYIEISKQQHITSSELRSYLSKQLPSPMVPSSFVLLETLPLTPNGKVDRHALATHKHTSAELEERRVAPRNELEEAVAASYAQVLFIERIGIHDDFFALGGQSLSATQVISRLRTSLHIELTLSNFFEAPTVAQLAEYISQLKAQQATSHRPAFNKRLRETYRISLPSISNTDRREE
jgi:amino acid adenylation domain-containing protein